MLVMGLSGWRQIITQQTVVMGHNKKYSKAT